MFMPNQRVVCIDGKFHPSIAQFYNELPEEGEVYTIRDIVPDISPQGGRGEVAVYLVEIRGTINNLNVERGFNAERFAPMEEVEIKNEEKLELTLS